MNYRELADVVTKSILLGAEQTRVHVQHSDALTAFQGHYIRNQHTIVMNAAPYLYGEHHDNDEWMFSLMMPLLVSNEQLLAMTPRDWQAHFLREQLLSGAYGIRIQQLYKEQHISVQQVLAYAVLDKAQLGTNIFMRVIKQLFPEATCYRRNGSTDEKKQLDWLIHIPTYEQQVAQHVVTLCAQLLLPISHVVEVIGQQPPALLKKPMHIGGVRLVDERFRIKEYNVVNEVEQYDATI